MIFKKTDTAWLKGISILMIMLHNFCHHLPKSVTENEYSFGMERFEQLCTYLSQGGPHVVLNIFSHFGHYGVPLFLFLSGYGLVCKYELSSPRRHRHSLRHRLANDFSFVWKHMLKLWKLMVPAIALYWAYCMWVHKPWQVEATDLAAMLTFTSNLFVERNLILGPWWFFSLILQLYIVYRFVFYHYRGSFTLVSITVLCFAFQAFLYFAEVRLTPEGDIMLYDSNPYHQDLFNYCRYNAVAWILPFAAGILAARSRMFRHWEPGLPLLVVCSMAGMSLTVWAATDAMQWLLSPLYVLMAFLPLASIWKGGICRRTLEWVGSVSATLFALHPIARAMTITAARHAEYAGHWAETYLHILLYLFISFVAAWILGMVLKQTDKIISSSWKSR